ncbi:GNAT family N-acetyltransferase [Spirosoma pollinicola]|uniref:GNAT family N-acetyltransferase n=1 Tax=Spirosoma pollinicola TaxID=2057025 RepID=A0A2K8Z4I5_9BACT|nr:GNAT family N-acetyltransferase [Spirosoma pollinicola]AUD04761.1 GNAT family N-acetyltransferase [Spirosoma pollinicola]
MIITTVQSEADVQGILALQQDNLRKNVPLDVQLDQGFVTVEHDPAVLSRMNLAAPSVIAKDGDRVVGYALTMLPEFGTDIPELLPLFALIDSLSYSGKPLSTYAYYVMGQVCVAEGYRGQKVFDRMYQHHREVYSDRFQLLITDISANNTRSLRAHARVGFEPIHEFHDSVIGETWVVVLWDWQK